VFRFEALSFYVCGILTSANHLSLPILIKRALIKEMETAKFLTFRLCMTFFRRPELVHEIFLKPNTGSG